MRDIKKYVKWYFNPPNMDKKLYKAMEREYRDSLIRKKKSFSNCVGGGDKLLIIPRLVISVSNKCSLRCEACNNLILYFEKSGIFRCVILEKILKSYLE